MTAHGWVQMVAMANRPKGRSVVDVSCGEFRGVRTEFATFDLRISPTDEDRWIRGWSLECDGKPLDVTYSCPLWCAGRDDHDVVAMLATLRAGPAARRAAP